MTAFWPTADHWSVKIPLDTAHPRLPQLAEHGYVVLRDADFEVPVAEYLSLEYMDWKSGGDTNFAPIASADGELDCRGFWDKGKTDKDAKWTSNAAIVPSVRRYVESVGANFGRVRVIKLEPQSRDEAIRSLHRDDNNRFNPDHEGWVVRSWLELTDNPDSYMLLMDSGPDGLPDPVDRGAPAAAPGLPVRRRHAAAVARRRPSRRRRPVRADHQLRIGSGPRRLDRRREVLGHRLISTRAPRQEVMDEARRPRPRWPSSTSTCRPAWRSSVPLAGPGVAVTACTSSKAAAGRFSRYVAGVRACPPVYRTDDFIAWLTDQFDRGTIELVAPTSDYVSFCVGEALEKLGGDRHDAGHPSPESIRTCLFKDRLYAALAPLGFPTPRDGDSGLRRGCGGRGGGDRLPGRLEAADARR